MRARRDRIQSSGQRRRQGEDADFERHLRRGRKPQRDEASNARGIEGPRATFGWRWTSATMFEANGDIKESGHTHAQRSSPTRNPQHRARAPQVAVDEDPVGRGVDGVGGHERDHDRPHEVHALEIAAKRGVEQKRQRAERDGAQ